MVFLQLIKKWCNTTWAPYVKLTDDNMNLLFSSIVSIFLVGGMIGSLAASWIADRAGR